MDKQEFSRLADACLERVTTWLETFDPDEVDYDSADGVVTLEFSDGQKYVLNRQTAASQMWFAAGAQAWHFDLADDAWRCSKDGADLYQRIAEAVSEKLGRPVQVQ